MIQKNEVTPVYSIFVNLEGGFKFVEDFLNEVDADLRYRELFLMLDEPGEYPVLLRNVTAPTFKGDLFRTERLATTRSRVVSICLSALTRSY